MFQLLSWTPLSKSISLDPSIIYSTTLQHSFSVQCKLLLLPTYCPHVIFLSFLVINDDFASGYAPFSYLFVFLQNFTLVTPVFSIISTLSLNYGSSSFFMFLPSQSLCILQASLYLFLTLFPLSRLVYLAGSFIGSSDQSFLLLLTPKCLYLLVHQMDFLLEFLNYFSTTCNVPPVFVLSLFSISTLLNLKMLIIDFLLSTLHHHFPLMFICT